MVLRPDWREGYSGEIRTWSNGTFEGQQNRWILGKPAVLEFGGRRESDFWSRLANSLTINQFSNLAHILSNRWILENDTNATREEQNRNGSDHS